MEIIHNRHEVFAKLQNLRLREQTIGLVPTMGALHDGHLSLVRRARSECDVVVATIFVNPSQFAPGEDFDKYPRTLDHDCELLAANACDFVFAPATDTIYPKGFSTAIDPPSVALPLEGRFRPTHFAGVCTIVLKLFHLLPATAAYFGRKDYQQVQVIRRMAEDLDVQIRVVDCPTVRESDGLALSSRNQYLSPSERTQAVAISKSLRKVESQFKSGETDVLALEQIMTAELHDAGISQIDYATIVDAFDLMPIQQATGPAVALIAARVGTTRLIDNVLLE